MWKTCFIPGNLLVTMLLICTNDCMQVMRVQKEKGIHKHLFCDLINTLQVPEDVRTAMKLVWWRSEVGWDHWICLFHYQTATTTHENLSDSGRNAQRWGNVFKVHLVTFANLIPSSLTGVTTNVRGRRQNETHRYLVCNYRFLSAWTRDGHLKKFPW